VAERHRDLDRLLTFVDAVVAIAITLLVLPLAETGGEVGEGDAAQVLSAHVDDLVGFALSFAVIAQLWLGQHRIVSGLVRQNTALIWLLLVWAFTIVFLPFPTSLVTTTDHDPLAKILYVGTMAVSSAVLALVAWVIRRDRRLRDTDEAPDVVTSASVTGAFLLALAIMLLFPDLGYWPLLLLAVVGPVEGLIRR
jgi:TMEM175 potassium channel family protein